MVRCSVHNDFFDENCDACKQEYAELKGILHNGDSSLRSSEDTKQASHGASEKKYKEFTEERAKQLYQDLLLQYLKGGYDEAESSRRAKNVIRKQCSIRNIPCWPWV